MTDEYFRFKRGVLYENILVTWKQRFGVANMIKDHMTNEYFKLRLAICVFIIPSISDRGSAPTLETSPACRTVLAMQLVSTNANRAMQYSDLVIVTIFCC
jgi:hypothetical protein